MKTDWPPDKNPQHPPSIHAKEDHGLTLRLDRMEAADAEPVHFTLGFQPGRKMPTIFGSSGEAGPYLGRHQSCHAH